MIKNKGLARFANPLKFIVVPKETPVELSKTYLTDILGQTVSLYVQPSIRGSWSHDSYSMA
jgi:hypothetical protein